MTTLKFPPRGTNPDLIRKLGKIQERIDLNNEPPPPGTSPHMVAMWEKMNKLSASISRDITEMQADSLEIQQIIDEGYEKGVLPIDQEMAASADEYQRTLAGFDRKVAADEAQWAQEDAAEPPRRK